MIMLPSLGRCEAMDPNPAQDWRLTRCMRSGARVLEKDDLGHLRTRIICTEHGFETDLFYPDEGSEQCE